MTDWLVAALVGWESYRVSHRPDLPHVPLSVCLAILSVVPAIILIATLNLWLPRQARMLGFFANLSGYLRVRPRQPRLWAAGLRPLATASGIQPVQWALLGAVLIAVPIIWERQVLAAVKSKTGRQILGHSADIGYAESYLLLPTLILALLLLRLLVVRGNMAKIGGPLGRFPVVALCGFWIGYAWLAAEQAIAGGTFIGPYLLLASCVIPAMAYRHRRKHFTTMPVVAPAWVQNPYAYGAPKVTERPKVAGWSARKQSAKAIPRGAIQRGAIPSGAVPGGAIPQGADPASNRLRIAGRPISTPDPTRSYTRFTQAAPVLTRSEPISTYDWQQHAAPILRLEPTDPTVLGPYRLTGRIATGGMAVVYLGTCSDRSFAAVKIARNTGDDLQRRLQREVDVLRRVRVHGIADYIQSGIDYGQLWVAMRYIPGPTLHQVIVGAGPLDRNYLRYFGTRLAEMIRDLHASGFIHRDIKPANIIINSNGPHIIDLGISILKDEESELTATGHLVGTPSYLSPEILLGQRPTPACDVYGWGCVMAYASIGRPLFTGGPDLALRHRIIEGSWDEGNAAELRHRDDAVARLINLTTHTVVDKRPADGQALLQACAGLIAPRT